MGKSDDPDSSESFEDLLGDVRRLKTDRVVTERERPEPIPSQRLIDEQRALEESQLSTDPVDDELDAGEALKWCRPGLERDLKRLRRGDFAIQGTLDLHGLTSTEAKSALVRFVNDARADDCRCIRIIHGKGLGSPGKIPVLKGKTAKWLRMRDDVLAYCSAPSHDGGTGVVYVLLRR